MRFLSVCSGIEAASVAWEPLGFKAVGFSEIEPFPCAVLKHRFPNTTNYGDLTKHTEWAIEPGTVDVLVGGPPCQAFSVAGLRRGLADPRGNLSLTYLGLVDRLRPKWVVYENVPGLLSVDGGRALGSLVGALGQLGYGWAYRVLDAQHFGVAQRRRRLFLVGHLGSWRPAAEVLSLREGLRGYLEAGAKKRKGPAADASASPGASGPWWDGSDTASTLTKKGAGGQQRMPDKGNFEAVVEAKPIVIDRAAFNQGENAQYEPHIEASETMDSLVARGPHAVGVPFRKSKRAKSTTDNETWVEGEVSNTLNNFDLGDIRTTHAVVEPIAIQGTIIGRGDNAGPQGTGATEGGPMFTLTKTDIHGVAHTMPGTVAPTIGASGPPYSRTGNERVEAEALAITFQPGNLRREAGADPSTEATTTLKASAGDQMPHVAYPMAVRRLTPIECERLQGFPDNWSRIPWKGKPEEECPDGPRYKACGNSMAVPVMRWIGERILEVEQHFSNGETL